MTRSPLLSRALREHGMTAAAQELDAATDTETEIWALYFALGAVSGASLVLRTHARVLRSSADRAKRDRLQVLENALTERLGDLARRKRATAARNAPIAPTNMDTPDPERTPQ